MSKPEGVVFEVPEHPPEGADVKEISVTVRVRNDGVATLPSFRLGILFFAEGDGQPISDGFLRYVEVGDDVQGWTARSEIKDEPPLRHLEERKRDFSILLPPVPYDGYTVEVKAVLFFIPEGEALCMLQLNATVRSGTLIDIAINPVDHGTVSLELPKMQARH